MLSREPDQQQAGSTSDTHTNLSTARKRIRSSACVSMSWQIPGIILGEQKGRHDSPDQGEDRA
jgi:hypothetical protein